MSTLNEKYAQALLTLAKKQGRVREIRDELETVRSLFSAMRVSVKLGVEEEDSSLNKRISAQLDGMNLFLKDERISTEVKREIAKTLLEGKVSDTVLQFVNILIEKNRLSNYNGIFDAYRRYANDDLGIREGLLESARELDPEQVKRLAEVLSTDQEKVEFRTAIDESLISGFRITFDDEVIDCSTKEKLREMTEEYKRREDITWI